MASHKVGYDDPIEAFVKRMYWTIYGPFQSRAEKVRTGSGLWQVGGRARGRLPIVASLGSPHQEDPSKIRPLLEAGADILRINFSHFRREWDRKKRLDVVKNVVLKTRELHRTGLRPEFMGDLQGPKIRIHNIGQTGSGESKARLDVGNEFRIDVVESDEKASEKPGDDHRVCTTYTRLLDDIKNSGAKIVDGVLKSERDEPLRLLLGDGDIELEILSIDNREKTLITRVTEGGWLKSKKGMTIPGVHFTEKALTEEDLRHLVVCLMARVENIALSFVSTGRDVSAARHVIAEYARIREDLEKGEDLEALGEFRKPRLIAKIETREAITNLASILEAADGVMVARGDLALNTSWAELPEFERRILRGASRKNRLTIAATEMLASMEEKAFPARSEVFGILYAIRNLAGACMLSGETSSSEAKHPATAVDTMRQLIEVAQSMAPMAAEQSKWAKAHPPAKSAATRLLKPVSRGRRTAIVASLVPSHELIDGAQNGLLEKLHQGGVDVFRLNLSIGSQGDHDAILQRLGESRKLGAKVFADFEGPKMFIGPVGVDFEHLPEATLKLDMKFEITAEEILGDATAVHCNKVPAIVEFYNDLRKRDRWPPILLGDRHVVLEVKDIEEGTIRTEVKQEGVIRPGMGITIPGFPFSADWLGAPDMMRRLRHLRELVDMVGLSFAEGGGGVKTLRSLIGPTVGIVAKIESARGLKKRDEILDADSEKLTGVMVSRGDLYLGLQGSPRIGTWAKELMKAEMQIIRSAQKHKTFSIVGTGMLGNLAHKSVPLRSEPNDIAQAIEWGCSGCLLLTETASVPDPLRAVRLLDDIIKRSEKSRKA
jgi:pyruvate kinase